jgi:hypothetical protein
MRKFHFLAGMFLALVKTNIDAQSFALGTQVINVGLGLGSTLYEGSNYSSSIPPISVSYEKCIKDNIIDRNGFLGVGGFVGMSSYSYDDNISNYHSRETNIIIGGRGSLHYQFVQNNKLDTYGGMMLGFNFESWSSNVPGISTGVEFNWNIFIGARYYLTDKISIMGELGYGISILTVGVGIKL